MFRVCHAFLTVHCSLVVTCWEWTNPLALLYVMFSCVFVIFPCGVLGQVWYLIVSIADLCLLTFNCFSVMIRCMSQDACVCALQCLCFTLAESSSKICPIKL